MKLLVAMVTALAVLSSQPTHAQEEFHDTTIKSEYVTVSLHCSNTTYLPINDTNPVSWMLPNFTVLYYSTPNGKFVIENDNWTLVIKNATADDLGQYHCLLPVSGGYDYFLVKLGLNVKGPYFEDLWEKYKLNTVIGVSAAGGFALLCVLLYLLDHFRYREPEEEERKPESSATTTHTTYDNQGFSGYVPSVELGAYETKNGAVAQSKPDNAWTSSPMDDDITAL